MVLAVRADRVAALTAVDAVVEHEGPGACGRDAQPQARDLIVVVDAVAALRRGEALQEPVVEAAHLRCVPELFVSAPCPYLKRYRISARFRQPTNSFRRKALWIKHFRCGHGRRSGVSGVSREAKKLIRNAWVGGSIPSCGTKHLADFLKHDF